MASLSLYHQFEANLMSNCNVAELLVQLKCVKPHGKNYIKVKPQLVHYLLRNCLLKSLFLGLCNEYCKVENILTVALNVSISCSAKAMTAFTHMALSLVTCKSN